MMAAVGSYGSIVHRAFAIPQWDGDHDMNNDGHADIRLSIGGLPPWMGFASYSNFNTLSGSALAGPIGSRPMVFTPAAIIGSGSSFGMTSGTLASYWDYTPPKQMRTFGAFSVFGPSGTYIIGIRLQTPETEFQYGWLRLQVFVDPARPYANILLMDYAYKSQPGVGIPAGAIPAPASVLALGAGAVFAGIRRRCAVTTCEATSE